MPCNGRAIRHLPTPRREIRPCTGRLHQPRTRAPHGLPPRSCGRRRNDRPFFSAPFFPIRRHAVVRNLFHPRKSLREPERSPLSRRNGRIRPSACARSIRRPQRRTSGPPTGNVTTDFNRAAHSSSDNGCRHPTCRSAETPVHRSACSDRLVHSSATIRRHLPSAAAAHLRCAALPSRT